MWFPQFDKTSGTNQVTAGQQQSTLPTLEWVCAHRTLTKALVQRLFHAPKLFLQVLANGVVAAFNQQLHVPWATGHLAFTFTLDSLLPALSTCPTDAPGGCL